MEVLIDQQEKKPWRFPPHVRTAKVHMKTGDYSVRGYEADLAIERKSCADLTSCLCDGELQRFCGQLQRLRAFKYRAVIVECDLSDLLVGKYRAPIPPDKVMRRLMDVVCRFKVLLFFGGTAKSSTIIAEQFMRSSIKQLEG